VSEFHSCLTELLSDQPSRLKQLLTKNSNFRNPD